MRYQFLAALVVTATVSWAPRAHAQVIAQSTFDANADGWLVADAFDRESNSNPGYFSTGGDPDGFIEANDVNNLVSFLAPAAFLGNQSAAYGGSISFDERVTSSSPEPSPIVLLSDGSIWLGFYGSAPSPINTWDSFDIPLVAASGWQVADYGSYSPTGNAATEAQLQEVLGNLQSVHVYADWHDGGDQTDLDNVTLTAGPPTTTTPEPSTMMLLGSGLLFVGGVTRRKMSRG